MPKTSVLLFILLFNLLTACSLRPGFVQPGKIPELASDTASLQLSLRIDRFVKSLTPQSFSGAIFIEKEGKLILMEAYGQADWRNKLAFTPQTLVHTAGLAHQLTAVAILQLEQRKLLSTQDSLGQFFPNIPTDKQGIRIQHLLTHTAGFPATLSFPTDTLSRTAFLEKIWQEPLQAEPGSRYVYAPSGYALLAAIIELRSGRPYGTYIQNQLLNPAGIRHMGYALPDFSQVEKARSEVLNTAEVTKLYKRLHPGLWPVLGSTGLLSTAEDIYLWQLMLWRTRMLPESVRNQLKSGREFVPDGALVYGWSLRQSPVNTALLQHTSEAAGFSCQLFYDEEEEISVVLVSNQYNRQVEHMGLQILQMLYDPNFVPAILPYEEKKVVRLPREEQATHVRALLEYVNSAEESTVPQNFIENHYAPEFIESLPEHMHIAALQQLRQRLSGTAPVRINKAWPYYTVTIEPDNRTAYLLRVQVTTTAPHLIRAIELKLTDNPE